MKRLQNKWRITNPSMLQWGLTLLCGLVVFLFWRYRYPFVLAYQEQLQLFLFDDDYLVGRLTEPGGFARYVAEFLTQFYNGVTFGALILAVVYMLIQRLTWQLMRSVSHGSEPTVLYPLSFIPTVMLWYAMGDESVLLMYAVALVMALAAAVGWIRWASHWASWMRWSVALVVIPLLYWLIGAMVLLVAACMLPLMLALPMLVYALACILLSSWNLPFPLTSVLLGIGYYRYPETLPYVLMALPAVVWLLFWVSRRIGMSHGLSGNQRKLLVVAEIVVVVLVAVLFIPQSYDTRKYELIEYDYLVRVNHWKGVIAKAEKKMPDLPMSVSAMNLALAMTDQLGDRAFDFYQRSTEGLLPRFERNYATLQLTGEIFFHLGLVNTAQRFAFEAMEAIPNYNKSARVVKRLAETNLINGQYRVAEKYLRLLEKTVFYRRWAQRTLAMLGDETAINAHPLYGKLRRYRLQDDLLFHEQELDKICGQLFIHNPENRMAAQYLLLMPLLDRDIPRFMQFVQVVQNRVMYNPRSCQEAIAFAFMQQRQQPPQGTVSQLVLQQMNEFARIYSSDKNSPALTQFKNTVWYYLTKGQ